MDNKQLFQTSENGFDCDQVEQYINLLKNEYKKVFEYAKAVESNNDKLKSICRSLSEENKALKAAGGKAKAADNVSGIDKIAKLNAEIAKEIEAMRSQVK